MAEGQGQARGLPVTGRLTQDPARPVVFALTGFMPLAGMFDFMISGVPEADVLTANLPGMHSPVVVPNDPPTAAAVFAEALQKAAPGRRLILLGASASTPVVLMMCARLRIEGLVLIEPFLEPMKVWALAETFTRRFPPNTPGFREMVDAYFGFFSGGRDYRPLQAHAPAKTHVVVGEIPLEPPRELRRLPSFTSEAERQSWREAGAEVHVCAGLGHDITQHAPDVVIGLLRAVL
jgi:pimeloyl-ACP methyl ester carboxylesterase